MASPIQIVLNPENFEEARESGGGGGRKDFYAKRDREFGAHKAALMGQIDTISGVLASQSQGPIGYVKVTLKKEAWAKSHRPVGALFRPDRVPVVGGGDLGVMIVEGSPSGLAQVKTEIAKAETQTRMRLDDKTGKEVPHPSVQKSETGAIERLDLYGASDKRRFSVEEAVAWLSKPLTGSAYEVELFNVLPPRSEWDRLDASHRRLVESFIQGFISLGYSMSVERLPSWQHRLPVLAVRLDQAGDGAVLRLTGPTTERRELAPFDSDIQRHTQLLEFLDNHPLVRRIELPGMVVRSEQPSASNRGRPTHMDLPVRDTQRTHPRIGIIDGGISPALADWVIDRWDILADEDKDLSHGTFIGGLAVAGASLNGTETCPEPDGAELIDLAIFPNQQKATAFPAYYAGGLPQFFDELDASVADARARFGVRVFNMSLNILQPTAPDRYSPHAIRLDRIAEENNAVVFVSAGNIQPQDMRPEWPADPSTALSNLAIARNDNLLLPAESARNVTVAALNPPGANGCLPFAPARYSRRGPGLRSGVKPDLAHVGGSGTPQSTLGHGLFSVLPDGTIVDGCGTSYAAPLVAKTAAVLDHAIEGEVSRETLIGLLVHNAEIPQPLRPKPLLPVARHLVGFGMPPSAQQILETDDHSITLVFASRIQLGQQINFRFSWPASLVTPEGKCRGHAKLTLVSTPPLDARFGSEFVRVNVNATLQQEQEKGWKGRLDPLYLPSTRTSPAVESVLIEHDLKWSPVKVFEKTFARGVGPSSNWRLFVEYLTRAGEIMPEGGVPFTVILTISDPGREGTVFNDMRQSLQAIGTQIADIRTAARITPRV
ncbi:S8 family peptidase [Gluconobacter sp. Dm-62]|uniref:S8 family peptidase n=1 Tax=Gluconobacter sp. Dm-62 TaxID=2799804 RepID=UPI001B8BEEEF|nr:S8 family peptidase [Gluconobacter sp. Dm-62]MBS1101692.1 S8 family peptidase [Gluconobacter sp. Dm-62]